VVLLGHLAAADRLGVLRLHAHDLLLQGANSLLLVVDNILQRSDVGRCLGEEFCLLVPARFALPDLLLQHPVLLEHLRHVGEAGHVGRVHHLFVDITQNTHIFAGAFPLVLGGL
jgi:hypothetical protein